MSAKELKEWLDIPESKEVAQKSEGHGSTGHASGRRIIKMLGKKKAELGPGDFSHTRKVNGYVQRQQAQRPEGDVRDSRWRYSLMNWVPRPSQVLARRFAEGSCRRRTLRGAD